MREFTSGHGLMCTVMVTLGNRYSLQCFAICFDILVHLDLQKFFTKVFSPIQYFADLLKFYAANISRCTVCGSYIRHYIYRVMCKNFHSWKFYYLLSMYIPINYVANFLSLKKWSISHHIILPDQSWISGCLSGMDYRLCDWQISCSNFSSISNCSDSNCMTGCFCSDGTVLEDSVCIHPDTCPSK